MQAHKLARRRKRDREEVESFELDLYGNLASIQNELITATYRVGARRHFTVREPQLRHITASPYRDRVAQWAVFLIYGAELDRKYIDDTFACRDEKGTHKAADRVQEWIAKMERQGIAWCLKTDLKKYFASISHALAKKAVRRTIKCPFTLDFLDKLIDTMTPSDLIGVGLTIGDLANQWIANLVGNELDQVIKREWRVKRYIRYMDDMVMILPSRAQAVYYLGMLDTLIEKHGFEFSMWSIQPTYRGVNFVGYRIFATYRLLRKDSIRRMRRRVKSMNKRLEAGDLDIEKAKQQINSWVAHANHATTTNLKKIVFDEMSDKAKIILKSTG